MKSVTLPTGSSSTASTSSPPAEITVTFKDVAEGRAFVRLPFVSKLLLCHWAGAPWADKNPNAHLHGLQTETIAHKEREQIVHGASRLGKSVLGGCKAICGVHVPKRKGAVAAANYMHVGHEWQYLYKGMKRLWAGHPQAIKRLTFKNQHNYFDFDCEVIWDTRFIGISLENEEGGAALGREITDLILGEGSHISKYIFETKLLRAADGALMGLGSFDSWLDIGTVSIFTTPKETQGCSASEWERVMKQTRRQPELLHFGRVPWAQTVWIREASILENPAYDRRVFQARKATLTARAFDEQYLGKMGNASGRVYSALVDGHHVRPRPAPEVIRGMKLAVGWDTGAFTAASLVGIMKDRTRWILGEVQTEKVTLSESVRAMKEMLVEVLQPVFLTDDPEQLISCVEVWAIDPASQHKLDLIELLGDEIGLEYPNAKDQRSLLDTTNKLNEWFELDQLFIAEECELTVEQYQKWLWKVTKKRGTDLVIIKEPETGNDHLCDGSRFGLLCLDNHGPYITPPPPVTFKEAWQAAQRDAVVGPLKRMLAEAREREEAMDVRTEEAPRAGRRAGLLQVVG
jgi:hypothetical protein